MAAEKFIYKEVSYNQIHDIPTMVSGCMVLLCTCGSCSIVTGIEEIKLRTNTSAMFLAGTSLFLNDCTTDFYVRLWEVDKEIYTEVASVIPPSLEHFIMNMPAYDHDSDDISLKYVKISMEMANLLNAEMNLPSALSRIRLFAKSYMLYLFDYISPRIKTVIEKSTIQQQLYRKFVSDIYQFCDKERQLDFYADRLCISVRYLSEIVRRHGDGTPAKQLISKQLIFKIKTLLSSTDMTVTQIATKLDFPDQSYLSRFFKRYTGYYPTDYRTKMASTLTTR